LGLDVLTLDFERHVDGAQLVAIAGANSHGKSTVMDNMHPSSRPRRHRPELGLVLHAEWRPGAGEVRRAATSAQCRRPQTPRRRLGLRHHPDGIRRLNAEFNAMVSQEASPGPSMSGYVLVAP
jgi:hypothetical protein